MREYLRHPATPVWALLFGATCLSWFLGGHTTGNRQLGTIGIIVIALVKIRFIIMYFMEIGHAPPPWRWIFEGWLVVVGAGMIGLYLFGQ